MTRLPRISGQECIRALEKAGFYIKHQKVSHIVVRRDQLLPKRLYPTTVN